MLLSGIGTLIKQELGETISGSPWPTLLPENPTLPAVVYMLIGGQSKPSFSDPGPQKRRIQIDSVASDFATAEAIREQLIHFLNEWTGTLPDGTFVQYIEFIQPLDMPFWNTARQYRCGAEFHVYFNFSY